jgi:hypothetical protein
MISQSWQFPQDIPAVSGSTARAIRLLHDEVDRNMAMLSVNRCGQLGRDRLVRKH